MPEAGRVAVILPAAGKSQRFGGEEKKIFAPLAGHPVWWHSANRLRSLAEVGQIIITINEEDRSRWEGEFGSQISQLQIDLVAGGLERYDSVACGLARVDDATFVAVHDAARPLVSSDDLTRLMAAANQNDAVMLACPINGTIKRTDHESKVLATVDRRGLWEAQTPQMFKTSTLREAYDRWRGWPITDDASLVERSGGQVCLVQGSPTNIKITTQADLQLAEAILSSQSHD